MNRIIKVSKISVKNIINNLSMFENFMKKFEKSCLNLVTVVERSIQEMIWFVDFFKNFWG